MLTAEEDRLLLLREPRAIFRLADDAAGEPTVTGTGCAATDDADAPFTDGTGRGWIVTSVVVEYRGPSSAPGVQVGTWFRDPAVDATPGAARHRLGSIVERARRGAWSREPLRGVVRETGPAAIVVDGRDVAARSFALDEHRLLVAAATPDVFVWARLPGSFRVPDLVGRRDHHTLRS